MTTKQNKRWPGIDCPDRAEEEQLALRARHGWLETLLALMGLAAMLALCGALAAQSGPEIELQCPPGTPIPSGSNDTSWQPTIAQGSSGQLYYRTVRILNLGTSTLTLSGNGHGSRSQSINCTTLWYHFGPPDWLTTVAPGQWQEFSLAVSPVNAGAWSFTYSLSSDDATGGENPYVINFSGTASAPQIGLSPALRIVTAPITGVSSPLFMQQPEVEALNGSGTRDTAFNGAVTASLLGGAGASGQLAGTVTVYAVNGLATFTDLSATQADSLYANYNIAFTANGYADAHSGPRMVWNFTSEPGGPFGGGGGGGGGGGSGSSGGGGGGGGCVASPGGWNLLLMAALGPTLFVLRRRRATVKQ